MVMTSDETQIQILANWPMSHAKRVTRDNWKNPEYRVVAAIRKLRTDKNCPAGKSWPNHVKNEQHIGSEKTYAPKNIEQLNIMMKRTANSLRHRAEATQQGRNSCRRLQFDFHFGLYRVVAPLSFHVVSAWHHCLLVLQSSFSRSVL